MSLTGEPVDLVCLERMTRTLAHRGPDDEGYLLGSHRSGRVLEARGAATIRDLELPAIDALAANGSIGRSLTADPFTVGLGVRRLAIRAPGREGHQPMGDPASGCWAAFNGEIYGDGDARRALTARGWRFASACDTETMLAAWATWGPSALARLNGMWAAAVWDARRGVLTCARDRFGIKPLYYLQHADTVLIASEIKAILAALDEAPPPCWPTVVDYVASRVSDHTDATFFEGIRQVSPGSLLVVDARGVSERRWDTGEDGSPTSWPEMSVSGESPAERFHRALDAAVDDHLESDARVGASLSGGLDSTSIVMAAARPAAPLRGPASLDVFTAVFDDGTIDERPYAQAAARAAGVRHHLVPIEPATMIADLPRVLWHQDEPILSTSVLAQWQVMKRAAETGVRVVLDGQGADELLGGYPALVGAHLADLARAGEWRQLLTDSRSLSGNGRGSAWRALARAALEPLPAAWRGLVARAAQRQVYGLHPDLVGYWRPLTLAAPAGAREPHMTAALSTLCRTKSLPALLRYLDRNGMAWSIEPRVPFLDRRVAAAARALSREQRFSGSFGKSVLRDARWSRLPPLVAERREKNGFLTPELSWWRGELRDWAADVLDPASVARHGVLDPAAVAHARDNLRSGSGPPPPTALWRWINIELWMEARERRSGRRAE